ncbi:MAG: hypothetical protein R3E63_04465 [Pseudomonadales bacterium]
MQGKIIIAFVGDLMRRIERRTEWGVLSEKDDQRINRMTRHIMKGKWIGDNRERLEKWKTNMSLIFMKCEKLA